MSSVTQPKANEICPTCDGGLQRVEVPKHNLLTCSTCSALFQMDGAGVLIQLDALLERTSIGDDRARAAVSTPHVSSVKSFLELLEDSERHREMRMAEAKGGLRTILVQAENRVDFAIGRLVGLELASDEVSEAVRALREARELISPLPGKHRGIAQKETHAATSASTSE